MAYIVGLLTLDEQKKLINRGWELEDGPTELKPDSEIPDEYNFLMCWVDSSMFDIMNGPDWDRSDNE